MIYNIHKWIGIEMLLNDIFKYLIKTTNFLWYPMGNAFDKVQNNDIKQGS